MKLIITEKSSVAQSIASVIGATQKRTGFIEGGGYIVSWCAGHLLELAAPYEYNERFAKWNYSDLPIIPDKWKHTPLKGKEAQLKVLKELMNRADVDCVINACDAGREGELIFRLVYEYAKCSKSTQRLWISSMEDKAIIAGMNTLKDGAEYDNLYAAASCREGADWLVGISSTRLFSVIYNATLQVGRVQSPTLAMLVKRHADIAAFVKEPFYMIELNCNNLIASGEKLKDKQTAENICSAINGQSAVVKSVTQKDKTIAPPKLYDLTSLQREANRLHGYTAKETLDYTQNLYEKRLCSYPRSDSRFITEDMEAGIPALIEVVGEVVPFAKIGAVNVRQVIDNSKVSDHHAIIPTMMVHESLLSSLPTGEKNILKMLAVRLIEAVGDKHIYTETTVTVVCGGNTFTSKEKAVVQNGWKSVQGEKASENDMCELSEGQAFDKVTAAIKEGFTTPPKHFTEDTLLAAMENAGTDDAPEGFHGLGTPATRAAVIEKIIKSGYVERTKKNLLPTEKGRNLISILPNALTSPKLTAEWEDRLGAVEKGELSDVDFMEGITEFIKQIVAENSAPKPGFVGLFDGKKTDRPSLGDCPRCKNPVREGKNGFFCDNYACGFKLWKESRFWSAKKKQLTAQIVTSLLKTRRAAVTGFTSEKTGKRYDATVVLRDDGGQFVNFGLEFENKGGRKR